MYIVIFLTMVFQSSAGWTDKKDFLKKKKFLQENGGVVFTF